MRRSSSRKQKERALINDEFTEFSQFGSRFMLNQPEEKNKKTNFVEHLQENKIFNKVATTVLNTCQKHYKKRTTQDQQNTYRQRTKHSETNIPVAVPRSKKTEERKMVKPKEISSSNENFLSVQGDLCRSVSIPSVNSSGKTLKYPNGLNNGSSTKSDTDSGISGDTYVGDIRIKQV